MRVLVAPDKFAGTLTAVEAAEAIAEGWRRRSPGDEIDLAPMSDGGPGFVDVLHTATGGDLVVVTVTGPLGEPLSLADLPSPKTKRWVVRRKAEVVAAVNGGLLTIDEVLERYDLTLEEFASWQRAVDRSGMQGLRVTRIQHYRDLYERQLKY